MRLRLCTLFLCALLVLTPVLSACSSSGAPDTPGMETETEGATSGDRTQESETGPIGPDPAADPVRTDEYGLLVSETEYGKGAGPVSVLAQNASVFSDSYDTLRIRITNGPDAVAQVGDILQKVSVRFLQFEIPVNADIANYTTAYPSYLLKDASGNVQKSGGLNLLMPFKSYSDYLCRVLQELVETYGPDAVILDAPQIPAPAFYGTSFQNHWQAYVGTKWTDPALDPEIARRMADLAETRAAIETIRIAAFVRVLSPDVRILLSADPSASDSYYSESLAKFDFDGTVVRVGSDPALEPVRYAGRNLRDAFLYTALSAATLSRLSGSASEITLERVGSGASLSADYLFDRYLEMAAALLLSPYCSGLSLDGEAYAGRRAQLASFQYRSSSLDMCLSETQSASCELHSGSTGIGILIPDPHLAALEQSSVSETRQSCLTALGYALLDEQILPVLLDEPSLDGPDGLASCSVLFVAGSMLSGLGEQAAKTLEQWVGDGGQLIYLGGDGQNPGALLKTVFGYDVSFGRLEWNGELSPVCADPSYATQAEALILSAKASGSCLTPSAEGAETVLTLSGQPMTVRIGCGEGGVWICGISCDVLLQTETAPCLIRGLAELASEKAGSPYVRGDVLFAQRGNYCIVRTGDRPFELTGYLMDLSDTSARVLNGFTVPAHSVRILNRIGEPSVPDEATLLLRSEGAQLENRESSSLLTFPGGAPSASAFVRSPGDLYPASVSILGDSGPVLADLILSEDRHGFFVSLSGYTKSVTLEIVWGTEPPVSLSVRSAYVLKKISVATNKKMEDQQWIDEITAYSNDSLHFCDMGTFLIYRFDLSQYANATFTFHIVQNYIIEMSPDKTDWVLLKDYSEGGTVPHTKLGNNPYEMVVTPAMYRGYDTLYVRLRNSDPSQGWGGSISSLDIEYYEKQ